MQTDRTVTPSTRAGLTRREILRRLSVTAPGAGLLALLQACGGNEGNGEDGGNGNDEGDGNDENNQDD